MRNKIIALFAGFFLLTTQVFGQFKDFSEDQVLNDDILSIMYRTSRVGIGFANYNAYNNIVGSFPPRLLVRDGLLAHYVSGTVGTFGASDKWCGLGIGNPGGPVGSPKPYGLAITDTNSVAFYNLLRENFNGVVRKNTIAGFGTDGPNNNNRFIIRGYSGTNAATPKDLLIANPKGSIGINEDPKSTFWVNSTLDTTPNLARAIAITGQQNFGPIGSQVQQSSASAIGVQANTSLATDGIVVEGFRAQIPTFIPTPTNGVAVNLQAVKRVALSVANPPINSLVNQAEYAELTWQDINTMDSLSNTVCPPGGLAAAQAYDKLFVSFRNGKNADPFGEFNKLPVMTFQGNGRVGIGTVQPTSGSGCVGGIYSKPILLDVNGAISSSGTLLSSDKRFKQNIKPVEDALSVIRRLQGTTYEFRTEEFKDRNFPQGNQYGFIAQDVEKVIPEMAFENSDGYYVVNYTMLIPVLTEAIKEQDKTITTQEQTITKQTETIEALSTEVAELRSQFNDFKAGQAAEGIQGYRLDQNTPNPTNGNTVIAYAVPANTVGARITVYDLTGRTIKTFVLNDQQGQINLNAGDLVSGLYIYDLQVNGRQILERKMTVIGKD